MNEEKDLVEEAKKMNETILNNEKMDKIAKCLKYIEENQVRNKKYEVIIERIKDCKTIYELTDIGFDMR